MVKRAQFSAEEFSSFFLHFGFEVAVEQIGHSVSARAGV